MPLGSSLLILSIMKSVEETGLYLQGNLYVLNDFLAEISKQRVESSQASVMPLKSKDNGLDLLFKEMVL